MTPERDGLSKLGTSVSLPSSHPHLFRKRLLNWVGATAHQWTIDAPPSGTVVIWWGQMPVTEAD